jgi:hypothetical protein
VCLQKNYQQVCSLQWEIIGGQELTYRPIDIKQEYKHAKSTVLCPKIRGGIVARSPRRNCWAMKGVIKRPNPRMQPQTLESCQGYVDPPHCSASRRHTIEQIRKPAPTRSISRIFSLVVKPLDFR